MRRLDLALLLTAGLCLIAVPAGAEIRILSSNGGAVGSYLEFFAQARRSGERVVIDGPCYSACTLVLSTIPRNRVCVTSRAVLGFHAPFLVDEKGHKLRAREVTRAVASTYPASVQAWINRHGGLTGKVIYLKGRELAALYPRC
jgi:hypothetical protein